jgi:hypothetical protein
MIPVTGSIVVLYVNQVCKSRSRVSGQGAFAEGQKECHLPHLNRPNSTCLLDEKPQTPSLHHHSDYCS